MGDERVVVLKGIPARTPRAWPRRTPLTLASILVLLQRIVAWSLAAAGHLALAALFLVFVREASQPVGDATVSLRVHQGGEDSGKDAEVEVPIPAPPVPEPVEPPPPLPEAVPEPVPDPVPVPPTPKLPRGFVAAAPVVETPVAPVPVPVPEAPPTSIGTGASSTGTPAPAAAAPAPAVTEADIDRDPLDAVRRKRAGLIGKLRTARSEEIVVMSGAYDGVEEVLLRLGIPFTLMEPERLAKLDLSGCKALLVNCHTAYQAGLFRLGEAKESLQELKRLEELAEALEERIKSTRDRKKVFEYGLEHLKVTSRVSALRSQLEILTGATELVANVRRFLERGGSLFTSDWGLTLVEKAAPGHVRNGGNAGPQTTPIRARKGLERHPLLEEVFWERTGNGGTAVEKRVLWEVDSGSYSIRVDKPAAVEVLVEGTSLGRWNGVAVTFEVPGTGPRPGRVLHVLSHFRKQASKTGDYALQNLLLNFLEAAGKRP